MKSGPFCCGFVLTIVVLLIVSNVSANPLSRLFMGASTPAPTPLSFERSIVGDWKIEKTIDVHNTLSKIETFNVTIQSTNSSIHYDLEADEAEGKAPGFKIRLGGAWTGTFLSASDLISGKSFHREESVEKKPVTPKVAIDELPEETGNTDHLEFEDSKGPIDPSSLVKIFDFQFQERENGIWISYGKWLDTGSYQFILLSPNAWLLTIFEPKTTSSEAGSTKDIVVVEFTAKRIPKVDDLPWYKKISFSGVMLAGLLILNISKRWILPKPPGPASRTAAPTSPSVASSSASAGGNGGKKKKKET